MTDRKGPGYRIRTAAAMLAVVVGIGACTGTLASSHPAATAEDPSSATSTAAATSSATPTPLPGLPAELIGTWETDLTEYLDPEPTCPNCGAETRLIIRAHGQYVVAGYGPYRPGGSFFVDDARITFDRSSRAGETDCDQGTYSWELDGDRLTFTAVEPDTCGRRADALDGVTYTRAD